MRAKPAPRMRKCAWCRMEVHPGRVGWRKPLWKGDKRWMVSCYEGPVAVLFKGLGHAELVRIRGAVRGARTWKARRTSPLPGSHIACTWTNTCRLLSYPVSQRVSLASFWPPLPASRAPPTPFSLFKLAKPSSSSSSPPRRVCFPSIRVYFGDQGHLGFHTIPSYPSLPALVFRSFFFS